MAVATTGSAAGATLALDERDFRAGRLILHHIPDWRKAIDEIVRVLKPSGSLFLEEPRGVDIKVFDAFFRWGHPDTDFGLNALDAHLTQRGLILQTKQWTPLLTMYHIKK